MPFTANDLRYHAEQNYPLLYAYLHRHAQRYLGALKYDAFEVDVVVGHVVEQLVRLGLLGAANTTPLCALDRLSDAQFYAFLNRSVRNKAIDRLRKRRLQVNTTAELEGSDNVDTDDNPLHEATTSIWGASPFSTPEEITLFLVSQNELRNLLKHCIMILGSAPRQLQAILQEIQELGADQLLHSLIEELSPAEAENVSAYTGNAHMSQHKDHAHKKLRHCLQEQSTNLTVTIALRLTKYATHAATTNGYAVAVLMLAQQDLTETDVRVGLQQLVEERLLNWQGEDVVHLTTAQMKQLTRFYKEE
ncbi:MAG: hypothetical protein NVS4B12_09120 [Ktedonobacteraceae bacterium]